MKKYPLFIAAILIFCNAYSQTTPAEKANIVTELIKLVKMQDEPKAGAYLRTRHCVFAGKNPHEGGFDYMYRVLHATSVYGLTVLDDTGQSVSTAYYSTISNNEYLAALNYVKGAGYLPRGDVSNPNFLAFAKGDDLVMLGIGNNNGVTSYTISASKIIMY
ncbi:hypothetical protein BEL04_18630 [Mucilaginibacter sp. PPCGB 2223]|uniref:hypothetical protein n=1 Tax=Mucilaginibacter sp. PPCGB 2223 TaxID=1886027 RepID=UPI000824BBDB|nr:hypothetical protein [Mucilaginibacter sp. PPCGB 2223]OCX50752.1 hypothetical protein BEL04_18630 [Mucilaginibacter sp. PPCGB 2223]